MAETQQDRNDARHIEKLVKKGEKGDPEAKQHLGIHVGTEWHPRGKFRGASEDLRKRAEELARG